MNSRVNLALGIWQCVGVSTRWIISRTLLSLSGWLALLAKQAGRMKRSQLVSRDVTEKVLERAYPGIGFRDGAAGREAYLLGHRVAVWEMDRVFRENRSIARTAAHFGWPVTLVKRALAYARASPPQEIERCRVAETT
jgi:hypothetical protein